MLEGELGRVRIVTGEDGKPTGMAKNSRTCTVCRAKHSKELIENEKHLLTVCGRVKMERDMIMWKTIKMPIGRDGINIEEVMDMDAEYTSVYELLPLLHALKGGREAETIWDEVGGVLGILDTRKRREAKSVGLAKREDGRKKPPTPAEVHQSQAQPQVHQSKFQVHAHESQAFHI